MTIRQKIKDVKDYVCENKETIIGMGALLCFSYGVGVLIGTIYNLKVENLLLKRDIEWYEDCLQASAKAIEEAKKC